MPASVIVARDNRFLVRERQRRIGRSLSIAYSAAPLKIVGGEGTYLIDEDGTRWLDMVNNVCHVGHCHPRVVKAAQAPYEAGRRGAAWVKVKPRHTLDLVVLAVERGSGRRQGLLSNIHLGARDGHGGFVMLGKTFKGMTDEMLAWQTQRFRELEVADDGWTVTLRPEQVVEIAFDGLQRSTRYPGGLALRFARVLRYRDDKPAAEADTIETVRSLATGP